jgi:short-subunit dehydrogenase
MARRTIDGCRGLLTGASSGIGYSLSRQLVERGARLLVVARRMERLRDLADTLAGAKGTIDVLAGDVTDAAFRQQAVARASELFGALDLLVNNAGSGAMGRFDEADAQRLRDVMEVNFFAAAELTRSAIPQLRRGRKPIVVNIGSVLAHRGVPFCAEYCASKFALRGLSESLRAEFASLGIDVLHVSPARTDTEFFASSINPEKSRWPELRGTSADRVARKIVSAIQLGRHEMVISASGKLMVWASRLLPRVMDHVLARYS